MPEFQLMDSFDKNSPSGWLSKFLKFSALLLVVVIIFYLILNYFYLRFLDRKIAEVENQIQVLEREIPTQDREEVVAFYSQLVNLKKVLDNHIYPSQIFERLELIAHPKVALVNFDYDLTERRIKVDGYAVDLKSLAEQLLLFQRASDFDRASISDIRQSGKDRFNFSMEVFFKPSLLVKKFQ